MTNYIVCPCPLERHIEVFSELTTLSAGRHHLSASSKTVTSHNWKLNKFYDVTALWLRPWLYLFTKTTCLGLGKHCGLWLKWLLLYSYESFIIMVTMINVVKIVERLWSCLINQRWPLVCKGNEQQTPTLKWDVLFTRPSTWPHPYIGFNVPWLPPLFPS